MVTESRASELAVKVRDVVFKDNSSVHIKLTHKPGYPSRKKSIREGLQNLVSFNRCLSSHFWIVNLEIARKFLNRKRTTERDVVFYIAHEFHHAKEIMNGKLKFDGKKMIYNNHLYRLRFDVNQKVYLYLRDDGTACYTVPWENNYDLDNYVVRMVCGESE